MKQLRSSRQLIKMLHRREKATIRRVAHTVREPQSPVATRHSAFTASGLAIEEQVRKAWLPCSLGLATF
jgi:hypothetical protein